MDVSGLIIQLASGALGGMFGGKLFGDLNLGSLGNIIAGLIGGGLGVNSANSMMGLTPVQAAEALAQIDPTAIIGQLAGGGLGGTALMLVMGLLQKGLGR